MNTSLLAFPFRPFFLLVGLYGAAVLLAWLAALLLGMPLPSRMIITDWHAHEMLYGWVPAAIAGFVLTAITNWTPTPGIAGGRLFALVALWLAGRTLVFFSGSLVHMGVPYSLVAAVDMSFFVFLAVYVVAVVLRYKNYRNLVLVLVLGLLTLGNGFMHYGAATQNFVWSTQGKLLGFNVITLVMIIIAGRITPAFSSNWLKRSKLQPGVVKSYKWLDIACIVGTLLLIVLDLSLSDKLILALAFALVALLNGARLLLWRGWVVRSEPLLWVLHLGYAWIVVALLLRALNYAGLASVSPSVWQHTLGAGAMATLIFGVMTRVAVGHTGRNLALQPFALWVYVFINLAALLRLITAFGAMDFRLGLAATAILWVTANLLFVLLYWPILSSPRIDGRPG